MMMDSSHVEYESGLCVRYAVGRTLITSHLGVTPARAGQRGTTAARVGLAHRRSPPPSEATPPTLVSPGNRV
jgi:hypothetical protein